MDTEEVELDQIDKLTQAIWDLVVDAHLELDLTVSAISTALTIALVSLTDSKPEFDAALKSITEHMAEGYVHVLALVEAQEEAVTEPAHTVQ